MEALTTALAGVPEWLQNFANEIFGYQAPQEGEASIGMVILLGVGIVFLGLICLVIVCSIFGLIGKAKQRGPTPLPHHLSDRGRAEASEKLFPLPQKRKRFPTDRNLLRLCPRR